MPTTLTLDLLRELESRWHRLGATELLANPRPGLSDHEMDELTQRFGFTLPPELRTWFRWRDGIDHAWLPWWKSMSLHFSLETETQIFRDVALMVREDPYVPSEVEWQQSWFAWAYADGHALFIDTAEQGPTSTVSRWVKDNEPVPSISPSLGDVVTEAISLIDCGRFVWRPGRGFDRNDAVEVPPGSLSLY